MTECNHRSFEAVTLRMQADLQGHPAPCPWCERDALAARLAEAERVILRMAGEGFARAKIYVDKYDLTGEQAARATDSTTGQESVKP